MLMRTRKQQNKKSLSPVYARLIPSCGCLGDRNGFMLEINNILYCQCIRCLSDPVYTAYAGLNGEHAESIVREFIDEGINLVLLPGVFSMTWYGQKHDPMKAKWASIEEYKASEEAKNHASCTQERTLP